MVNADPLPHEEPNGSSKSSSYHPEPPKMAQNYPRENQQIPRSENSTESESASTDLPDLQGIFYPSLEDQTDGCRTPKRKRPGDEEELSDNSPLQEAFYNKKQRRESMRLPKEIPSTPGSSPTQTRISRSMAVRDVTPPFAPHDAEEHQKDDHQEDISEDEENDYGETVEEGEELECLETLLEGNGLMGRQASPVLSEPDPTIRSTQRIFNDETQQIDFDVPPPEQGWGENSSPSQSSNSEHSHEAPNDWTIELLPPESPPAVSSPPLSPSDPLITATIGQLDTWLDDHVAAGHTLEETKHALRCTSMDRDLADLVLEHIRLHAVIPDDMPGVWTTADDEDLESVDSRKIGRVQAKHGTEAVDLRWLYWDAVKNSERSS